MKLNTKADFQRAGIRVNQNAATWREDGILYSAFFWKQENGRFQADRFHVVTPVPLAEEIRLAKSLSMRTNGRVVTSGQGMARLESVEIKDGRIVGKR